MLCFKMSEFVYCETNGNKLHFEDFILFVQAEKF